MTWKRRNIWALYLLQVAKSGFMESKKRIATLVGSVQGLHRHIALLGVVPHNLSAIGVASKHLRSLLCCAHLHRSSTQYWTTPNTEPVPTVPKQAPTRHVNSETEYQYSVLVQSNVNMHLHTLLPQKSVFDEQTLCSSTL